MNISSSNLERDVEEGQQQEHLLSLGRAAVLLHIELVREGQRGVTDVDAHIEIKLLGIASTPPWRNKSCALAKLWRL